MNRAVLVGLPILVLVAGSALSAEPGSKYDGTYTGKRSLTKGTASKTCPAEDNVAVIIHGETLTLTNSSLENYIMPFDPAEDGSFGEIHMDEGGRVVQYHGRIVGDVIEADVENSPCNYHWYLKKEHRGQ